MKPEIIITAITLVGSSLEGIFNYIGTTLSNVPTQ